jgi:kynurenine formamidase
MALAQKAELALMWHDLTHPIRPGMTTYPGDPPVRVEPWPDALPWQVSAVCLGSHTGTHIDAPRHVDPTGRTLSEIPPDRFIGRGFILDVPNPDENEPIAAAVLKDWQPGRPPGSFVLIRTGWDRYWLDDRYLRHPYLSAGLAAALAALDVALVGIDALSVDSSVAGDGAAHRTLLGNGVLIVENLRGLWRLDATAEYACVFAPLALAAGDGAPVRALARRAVESNV